MYFFSFSFLFLSFFYFFIVLSVFPSFVVFFVFGMTVFLIRRQKHADLRISEDAGHYLCDFIYFSSLAHLYKAGEPRKVLFLHVPSDASENSVALGRELLLQLVRSVVESEVARRAASNAEAT
jgi:pyrrolidone-carboxylate peptidase